MAGYAPPLFYGKAREDPEEWIRDFRQYCEASGLDPLADARTRVRIHGLFETCLRDDAKDWYETHLKNKNWELQNISDNTGLADLGAINGLANNNALRNINANQFRGGALQIRNTVPADNNAIAIHVPLVPAHTVFDENWLISGGRPTELAPNAPNANAGGNTIAPGIRIGQWYNITQGTDPIGRFYVKLKRMVGLAYPALPALNREEMVRQQFFQGLSPDNKIEVRRIGLEYPISALLPKLKEIERQKAEMMGQYNPESHPVISRLQSKDNAKDSYITSNTDMTETEVRNLVKSMMLSEQSQPVSQTISSKPQENQITLSQNDFKKIIAGLKGTIAKGQQTLKKPPGPGKRKADDLAMDCFLENLIDDPGLPGEDYDYDPVEDLRLQFEEMDINRAKLARIIHAVLKSSQYKCSKCGKTGHNSRNCPKNKKKSKSRRSNKSGSKKKAMFNDPEVIETIKNNINNTNVSMTRRVAPEGPAQPDFINYREPAPEIPESDDEEETLNDPMEIDFVRRKEPVISIATIPVKIKRLKIPALVLDSGAEPAIVSEDIVKRIGGKIDRSEKYDLSGVATVPTESVGITHNLPITFPPGFTIREDFVVVRVPKPTLIFPNPLLKKYKCAVDWGNDKMKIHYNGEDFIIPVTMHKVKK
ncbi:8186_t:CDS:2 [Paraglomus brasilianum]|uniref:8186_t:CDS:1 n=1 Tax=Paraglomus brasilianum TaxID=144538 RepID=A0A9N9DCA6_9GLOM|nr:8186_t:CDS:2 [Paraglomus brasilianum]